MLKTKLQYTIFLILTRYCLNQWREIDSGTIEYPAHIYSIVQTMNDQVRGIVSWDDAIVDLDLYVYGSGLPILDDSRSMVNFTTTSGRSEAFEFDYIPSMGRIFLRVYPKVLYNTFTNYSIQINITNTITNNTSHLFHNGIIYKNSKFMNFIRIPNLLPNIEMTIKYEINSTDYIRLRISALSQYGDLTPQIPVDLPIQSSSSQHWTAVFNHAIDNSYTTVQSFTFRILYTTYDQDYYNQNNKNGAQQLAENNQTTKIIMISVGISVSLGIFVVFVRFIYRKCRPKSVNAEETLTKQQLEIQEEQSKETRQKQQKQICSICLDGNCNVVLPCRHRFHKNCIKEWEGRNHHCPLCRKDFDAKDVKVSIFAA